MLHRTTIGLAVALIGAGIQACNDSPTFIAEEDRILAIMIINSCRVIEVGAQCTLSAQAFAEGGFEIQNPPLLWSSSQPQILAVEGEGGQAVVRGLRDGVAIVTARVSSDNDVSHQVNVTVVGGGGGGGEEPDGPQF